MMNGQNAADLKDWYFYYRIDITTTASYQETEFICF